MYQGIQYMGRKVIQPPPHNVRDIPLANFPLPLTFALDTTFLGINYGSKPKPDCLKSWYRLL